MIKLIQKSQERTAEMDSRQMDIIFEALCYRKLTLEDAKKDCPHAIKFIQEKIDEIEAILDIVGPFSA